MGNFIRRYALEIYTVLAIAFLVVTSFMNNLSAIQLFVVVFDFLFILHEWEENAYPGGFVNLISSLIEKDVPEETKRATRIPTGILLITITLLSFFFDRIPLFAVSIAVFGCFEGFIHIMGIRIFGLKKKYTPGMVTAELAALTGISLIVYLAVNHLAAWYDYVGGFFLFIAMFMCMQKTITMMVGIRYRDLPKLMKKQIRKIKRGNLNRNLTMVFLFTMLCSGALYAQDNKEAIIYLNGGSYFGSHNNMGAYIGMEYDRQLDGNWYWGAGLSGTYFLGHPVQYDWDGTGKSPYRNTVDQNIYKADAMIYYRLPVIKDIVLLRPGAGFGLGYHDIFDDSFAGKDKVIPYLIASLNWIIKCGKHLEFVLSPTIALCPSEFDYSFVQLGGSTDINPWLTNCFVSLGIGYRF